MLAASLCPLAGNGRLSRISYICEGLHTVVGRMESHLPFFFFFLTEMCLPKTKFVHRICGYVLERNNRSENTGQVLVPLANRRGKKGSIQTKQPTRLRRARLFSSASPQTKIICFLLHLPTEIFALKVAPLIPEILSIAYSSIKICLTCLRNCSVVSQRMRISGADGAGNRK